MSGYGAARVGELPGCVAPNAGSLRPPWKVPGPSSGCSRPAAAPRPNRLPAERCWAAAGALPGLRVLSRNSPSTPSAMNRACQVHTTGFDLPDRRMISAVPQPSALARITLARHTCFCGALRSATIASSRRRSARLTLTTIPALIMRAWTASADLGIVRKNQTTMMSWRVILILAVILSSVLVTLGWCIILIMPAILGWALILSWLLDGAMWVRRKLSTAEEE